MESGYSIERPEGDTFYSFGQDRVQFLRNPQSTNMTGQVRCIYMPVDDDDSDYERIKGREYAYTELDAGGSIAVYDLSAPNSFANSVVFTSGGN